MIIQDELVKYQTALQNLINLADNQFDEENCPLKANHYILSEQLFGPGCWNWDCGFCGKHFEE